MQADSTDHASTDPDRLYWDEHVARGRKLVSAADSSSWELGRLAIQVETTYGDNDLQKFADLIGVTYDSLRDYRYVAARFADRSANLPFTVMRQIARVDDPAERLAHLQQAEREHWTVSRARRAIAQRLTPAPPPPDPRKGKGFKAENDRVVIRFTNIASAFESLAEDEDKESAEPEEIARSLTHERRRAAESAIARATQFVDRWIAILEIEVSAQSEDESA